MINQTFNMPLDAFKVIVDKISNQLVISKVNNNSQLNLKITSDKEELLELYKSVIDEVLLNNVGEAFQRIVLTRREEQCLILLIQGKSAKQVGRELKISHRTAESYLSSIKNKFGCRTRMEVFSKLRYTTYNILL
jgi:DNA-binding CsgD family transcriptional regulator